MAITLYGSKQNIIQVVQGMTSTSMTTTSTTPSDTNLTANITPSSASNKILVLVSQNWYQFAYTYYMAVGINILRNGTTIFNGGGTSDPTEQGVGYLQLNGLGETHLGGIACLSYLDSPATTSAITYKTQGYTNSTGSSRTAIFQRSSRASTITLIEVAYA